MKTKKPSKAPTAAADHGSTVETTCTASDKARFRKELLELCEKLGQLMVKELSAQIDQGRLIADFVSRNKQPSRTAKRSKWGKYGEHDVADIAAELGCDAKTVYDRLKLAILAKDYGEHKGLTLQHYKLLWEHHERTDGKKLTAEEGKKFLEAAVHGDDPQTVGGRRKRWTAERLRQEVDDKLGSPVSVRNLTVSEKDVRVLAGELQKAAAQAARLAKEGLDKAQEHPEYAAAFRDRFHGTFISLMDSLRRLSKLSGDKGAALIEEISSKFHLVQPTESLGFRYVGTKDGEVDISWQELARRICTDRIRTAADLFTGRGSVAYSLKQRGIEVWANDLLKWPSQWAKWIIEGNAAPLTKEEVGNLFKGTISGRKYSFMVDEFANPAGYRSTKPKITEPNALTAQLYMQNADRMFAGNPAKRDAARALLASAIFDTIPFSGSETHTVPKELDYDLQTRVKQSYKDYSSSLIQGRGHASQGDAVAFLGGKHLDLVYMDVPYAIVGKEKHYYAPTIPESICRGEFVPVDSFQNLYGDIATAMPTLSELFRTANEAAPLWLFAYHSDSDINAWQIGREICKWRATAIVAWPHELGTITTGNPRQTNEYLFICTPYPKFMVQKNWLIMRTAMTAEDAGVEEHGECWFTPAQYTDPNEPRVTVVVTDSGIHHIECHDHVPHCNRIVDEVGRLLVAAAKGEPPEGEPLDPRTPVVIIIEGKDVGL